MTREPPLPIHVGWIAFRRWYGWLYANPKTGERVRIWQLSAMLSAVK